MGRRTGIRGCAVAIAACAVAALGLSTFAPPTAAATSAPTMACVYVFGHTRSGGYAFLSHQRRAPTGRCLLQSSRRHIPHPVTASYFDYLLDVHWHHWGAPVVTGVGFFGHGLHWRRETRAHVRLFGLMRTLGSTHGSCGTARIYTKLLVRWSRWRSHGHVHPAGSKLLSVRPAEC